MSHGLPNYSGPLAGPLAGPRGGSPGGGLIFTVHIVATLNGADSFGWIYSLRKSGKVRISSKQINELFEHIFAMPGVPELQLPGDLRFERTFGDPFPCIRIYRPEKNPWATSCYNNVRRLHADLSFDYDDEVVPWMSPRGTIFRREPRRVIERNRDVEAAARERLRSLGFREPPANSRDDSSDLVIVPKNLTPAVTALVSEGWRVEAEGALYRTSGSLRMRMQESGIDSLELDGEAIFDDQHVDLPTLLEAIIRSDANLIHSLTVDDLRILLS